MEIKLHNTSRVVQLEVDGVGVPARVWEGHTAKGVPVIAFITRVAAERSEDLAEFERDLQEVAVPSPAVEAWPLRMVL
jgi:hypothetical protein